METAQNRFLNLRQRLSDLNYRQTFGVESLDLVENLINDLVTTTRSYKQVSDRETKLANDLSLAQAQLFPVRKENARLARENHELHVENIRQNDENRGQQEEFMINSRHLMDEVSELQHLCRAKDQQLKERDVEFARLQESFDALNTPAMRSSQSNHKIIKVSSKPDHSKFLDRLRSTKSDLKTTTDEQSTEKMKEYSLIIESLQSQLNTANTSLKELEITKNKLESALDAREKELQKSSKIISSAPNLYSDDPKAQKANEQQQMISAVGTREDQLKAANTANKRIIDQLNNQVDFLNEQLAMREKQLTDIRSKLQGYELLEVDLSQKNSLLVQAKEDNSHLSAQITALESKLLAFQNQGSPMRRPRTPPVTAERSPGRYIPSQEMKSNEVPNLTLENKKKENTLNRVNSQTHLLVGKLTAERDELRNEVDRLHKVVSALKTNKPGFAKNSKNPMGSKNSQTLIVDLNKEVENANKKLHAMKRTLTQKDEQIHILENERDGLKSEIESYQRPGGHLDQKAQVLIRDLKAKCTELENDLAECTGDRAQMTTVLESAKSELQKERAEKRHCQTDSENLKLQLTLSTDEAKQAQDTCKRLRTELSELHAENGRLRITLEGETGALNQEKSRIRSMEETITQLQLQLEARSSELNEAAHKMAVQHVSSFSGNVEDQLRRENQKLLIQLQDYKNQEEIFNKERDFLEKISISLGFQYQREKVINSKNSTFASDQLQRLLAAIDRKDLALKNAEIEIIKLEEQLKRQNSNFQNVENEETSLRLQLKTAENQRESDLRSIRQYESELQLLKMRFNEITHSKNELEQKIDDCESSKALLQEQLLTLRKENENFFEQKNRILQERQLANLSREELESQLQILNEKWKSDRDQIKRAAMDRVEMENRISELTILISTLEESLKSEQIKSNRLQNMEIHWKEEKEGLMKEKRSFLDSISIKDKKIKTLHESLKELDKERDQLQEIIDENEDSFKKRQNLQQQQENQIKQLREALGQAEHRVQDLSEELANVERLYSSVEAKFNNSKYQLNELQKQVHYQKAEVGGAADDLMLMTRENQALTGELAQVSMERDSLRAKFDELKHNYTLLQQGKRSVEIEKNDLLETYRRLIQEKRKIERDLEKESNQRNLHRQNSEKLEEKLAELRSQSNSQSRVESHFLSEKRSLQQEIENLHDNMTKNQFKMEAFETENRKLMQMTHGLKQTNQMLNERIQLVIKRAAAAADANKLLTTRLSSVEKERDAVRALVGVERQRASDLSHIAETARIQAATKDIQIQRMKSHLEEFQHSTTSFTQFYNESTKTETKTEMKTENETEMIPENETENETEMIPENETENEMKPENETEMNTENETEMKESDDVLENA